jgi:putative NADPH-quinone reductase
MFPFAPSQPFPRRIAVIQGHPDEREDHFGHALAEAYSEAAIEAGHEVRSVIVAQLEFPQIRTREEWSSNEVPEAIQAAQEVIWWAEHLLVVHPLWLGMVPATFKSFLEQVFRPGFAVDARSGTWTKRLGGRSARVVVTMGMSATMYRWGLGHHAAELLGRSVFDFAGIAPVRTDLIGQVDRHTAQDNVRWLERMRMLGAQAR